MSATSELERQLAAVVGVETGESWRLTRTWQEPACLCLALDASPTPREPAFSIVVELRNASAGTRAYRTLGAVAASYRGSALPTTRRPALDRVIEGIARVLQAFAFDPAADALPAPDEDAPPFPTPYHCAHLETPLPLAPSLVETYRRDGHVLVRRALLPDVVLSARPHLRAALQRAWPTDLPPVAERSDAYSQSFTQITDVGLGDPVVRTFTHSRRLARMAAQLMGVEAVRIFTEDWLVKEAGARITPWHQDQAVFPFDTRAAITAWVPLATVGARDGRLRFARGSQRLGLAPIEDINDVSEAQYAAIIAEQGLVIDELPPVFPGDVSFHDGLCIHGAFPNEGEHERVVLALHFFADGARLKAPSTPTMVEVLAGALPGGRPGDPAVSASWPLVGGEPVRGRIVGPTFHVRATPLPAGGPPIDLWIENGRLRTSPVAGAAPLVGEGRSAFVTSGLVDAHAHISYPHERGTPVGTPRWMNAQRAEMVPTGVLLLRDMGAVDDAISALVDVPGLPRVQASGNMILRYDDFPFTRCEPDQLVRACAERVERGARWVKVFADFTSDYRGRINSGFTEHDDVAYPVPLLAEAVAVVHSLGARLAAHCFTRGGAAAAIAAGVDSLEHGWGVDDALVAEMAARGIAWTPLVGIAGNMWRIARRDGELDRATWIERTLVTLAELMPLAQARGVCILAGTDLFPEVIVADEIAELHALGLDRTAALAAGSWSARAWLGEPGLVDGAPADLVLYAEDPREDLTALCRPTAIVAAGELVTPSLAHVRPRHRAWRERES